ncbi:hypothetical protein [Microcella alkaliphila]|uniref:Uncharacterized protein n=1 Tax=Microcella alkaliphila TaxID=279828 RepID=A0A0U5BVH6_9MICO|nr:hypothetical protein [Microcella alkaliphila]BAU32461.1 uncharacterized protein MalAC0309_1610 [Microcella alkaliphila]
MSDLKPYEVEIPGRGAPRRTTLLLSDEDAKKQGLLGKHVTKKARQPQNKAAKPASNKSAAPAADK